MEIGTIKETKEETKKEYGFEQKLEVIPITKEEIKLGNEALEEILNDDDDKKDDNSDNNSKTNISTENEESLKSDLSEINYGIDDKLEINLGQDWDNLFNDDINKINEIKYENNKLVNEIKCQIKKDKDKDKNNQKDKDNSVSEIICSLKEGLPDNEKSKIDDMVKELNEIHEVSQKEKERRKNEQKKNGGKKKDEDNSKKSNDDDTIEINGVKKPIDHSEQIGNFYEAFRNAKMAYNIPKNRPPDYWTENYDNQGHRQKGRIYVYLVVVDGVTVMLEFRNDYTGHEFEKGYTIPGHINGPNGEHYFHNGFGEFTNFKDKDEDPDKIKHKTKEQHEELKDKYLYKNKKLIKKLYKGKI